MCRYGSTEAIDEYGAPYTEYLMRCQWGTSFDNMKPWIVAHRYSEFHALHQQLKAEFPRPNADYPSSSYNNVINLPRLPSKEFFNSLDLQVVEKRRNGIEAYFTEIVSKMPTVLKSRSIDNFLFVSERIKSIKTTLAIQVFAILFIFKILFLL